MTLEEKIKYLESHNHNYGVQDNKLVLDVYINKDNFYFYKDLLTDCIINANLNLGFISNSNIKNIPNNFLKGCIINGNVSLSGITHLYSNIIFNFKINNGTGYETGSLHLYNLEYLSKCFCPKVKNKIYFRNLKSKLLSDLLHLPGTKRELGFNLLKNV
jgi:hypothetical protein